MAVQKQLTFFMGMEPQITQIAGCHLALIIICEICAICGLHFFHF